MSKRIFNKEQIDILRSNVNVGKCSERSINYNNDFKIKAIKQYQEGLTAREIFHLAGFELRMIGREAPKTCVKRWNRVYKQKGIAGLENSFRGKNGGRKKKKIFEGDIVKKLEAEVAYLKAENDFLIKLRAKRKE